MFPSFQSVVICHGGRIGFFQGDIRLLPDDMKALRPTIFPVVPRLLNRMYDKVSRRTDQTRSQRDGLSVLHYNAYNTVICIVERAVST